MIDSENIIKTVANNCEVTIYFKKEPNLKAQENVLDILLSSYEKRMENAIQNTENH